MNTHNDAVPQLSVPEAHSMIKVGATLIDVRTAKEIQELAIPGSIRIGLDDLRPETLKAQQIEANQQLIFHCRSGGRSQQACLMAKKWGYTQVANLQGGINSWQEMGYETE